MELERKKEIAAEMISRAVEISASTKHDVFVDYSPHVKWIELTVYKNGWDAKKHGVSIFVDMNDNHDTEEEFNAAMAALESLTNN